MDRRHLLAGLAAAVAAGPALAQQSPSGLSTNMPSGANASGTMGMSSSSMQMTEADMRHMQETMAAGMFALEHARIGLDKARNENVKMFAMLERDEQTTIAEVLKSMSEPMATASTAGAATTGSTAQSAGGMAMPKMEAEKAQILEKLRGMQAGAEFDRTFVQQQLQGHQELLQIQERYLQSNPRNREHVNVAKLARGHIKEHIAELQDIQKGLSRG